MDKLDYINLIFIPILIIISKIINYIIKISLSGNELNKQLISNDIYITNDFCKCHTIRCCNINIFKIKCNLCKIDRVINFENDNDIYKLLSRIGKSAKFIIHTEGGETDLPNFLTYILSR